MSLGLILIKVTESVENMVCEVNRIGGFGRYGQKSGQNDTKIIGHANILRNMRG